MGDTLKVLKYNQRDQKIGPRKSRITDRLFIKTDEVVSPKKTHGSRRVPYTLEIIL